MSAPHSPCEDAEGVSSALALAVHLAGMSTLRDTVDLVLPTLARAVGAAVAIFAVAGSEAPGPAVGRPIRRGVARWRSSWVAGGRTAR